MTTARAERREPKSAARAPRKSITPIVQWLRLEASLWMFDTHAPIEGERLAEAADEIGRLRGALATAEAEARRYAESYPQSSDGRNTFLMLADKIASLGERP